MSSSSKIQKLKEILTANGGCGCGPKATDIVEPKPKSKTSDQKSSHCLSLSDSSSDRHCGGGGGGKSTADDDCTSTTFSLNIDASPHGCHDHTKICRTVSPCPKIHDSFAISKDSDDPYQDFRQSMLQMILEKEIYSRNDLQQLLDCFLQLNSPSHHEMIVQAFMDIWKGGIPAAPVLPLGSPEKLDN